MTRPAKTTLPAAPPPAEGARIEAILAAAEETRAEEILLFDMENRSTISDFVVICSGRSQAHVRGIADKIEESLRTMGVRCSSTEGYQEGSWVLLDYGLVIVHIFHPETRAYYDLEELLKTFPSQRRESEEPSPPSADPNA